MLSRIYKPIMENQQCSHLRFDYSTMKRDFQIFYTQLEGLQDISFGDKITVDESNNIIIQPSSIYQSIQRWWYSETREQTFEYLKEIFSDYFCFIDMCVDASRIRSSNRQLFIQLAFDNIDLQDRIISGLLNLKRTYEQDSEDDTFAHHICIIVDKLVDMMQDFKSQMIERQFRRVVLQSNNSSYKQTFTNNLNNIKNETFKPSEPIQPLDQDGIDFEANFSSKENMSDSHIFGTDISRNDINMNRNESVQEGDQDQDQEQIKTQHKIEYENKTIGDINSLEMLKQHYPGKMEDLTLRTSQILDDKVETSSIDEDDEELFLQNIYQKIKDKSKQYETSHRSYSYLVSSLDKSLDQSTESTRSNHHIEGVSSEEEVDENDNDDEKDNKKEGDDDSDNDSFSQEQLLPKPMYGLNNISDDITCQTIKINRSFHKR